MDRSPRRSTVGASNEPARRTGVIPAPPHRSTQTLLAGTSVAAAIILLTRRGPRHGDAIDVAWQKAARDWKRRYL
jgi:hypothetical protein